MSIAAPVDLTNCDREPIHVPGSIQPHGVLLCFVEPSLEIVSASASCEPLLGIAPDDLVGRRLDTLFDAADLARVLTTTSGASPTGLEAFPVHVADVRWTALVHRHDGVAIVELDPVRPAGDDTRIVLTLSAAARQLQATTDPVAACRVVAREIRRITGFARVKLYRFAADWTGEVLAESRDEDMPSYLGLHFPASDIPVQARALYATNPVRLIADARYVPSPLVPDRNPVHGGPIDLRYAALRSVSPIHLEYLRNMDVGASMSAAIVRNGALWGLAACHHPVALQVDFERRQACALIAQLLAAHLDTLDRIERARRIGRVEALRVTLLHDTGEGLTADEALARSGSELLRPVDASGFALVRPALVTSSGVVPAANDLATLTGWLSSASFGECLALDRLDAVFPDAATRPAAASGLLAVPLSRTEGSYLLWFRPERIEAVHWAGEPAKAVERVGNDERLHPRRSFASWTEQVRGRSAPWTAQDIAAALQLREVVLDLVVREKDVLERRNLRLVSSARELETFIYVASHDIKEPLRQMEMLTSLLRGHLRDAHDPEAAEYLREFGVVAARLRALTDQLADYARLGRVAPAFGTVRLDDVVEEVASQLRHALRDAGATLRLSPLPVVRGERAQLHQVFVNLIGNAIKYRLPERPLVIDVAADAPDHADDGADATGLSRAMARIRVADNGMGFDPKYDERVFDAFWRLHPRDRFEGSGIGLAICRRIVDRHDGRIEARGAAGEGATFVFTIPAAVDPTPPLPEPS